jgi:hypothetical protein
MKRRLLNEGTIRRFQKLANIPVIREAGEAYDRDEEELPPDLEGDIGGEEDLGDMPPVEDEMPVEDEFGDLEGEGGDESEIDISPEELEGAASLLKKLSDAAEALGGEDDFLDEPIDDLGGEEEEDFGAGDEAGPVGAPFEAGDDMGLGDEDEALEEALRRANIQVVSGNKRSQRRQPRRQRRPRRNKTSMQQKVVKEVMKRVVKRLLAGKR